MTMRRTRCPHCKGKLEAGHRIHEACIEPWHVELKAKEARAEAKRQRMAAKVERATTRQRKAALKTIPDLIKEAQREFNAYIRARDQHLPCICCGNPLGDGDVGGAYDCGHYRSTGSAPHLRFDERNAHAQRKFCNRYGAGRAVDYRVGLIARIGQQEVERLEADNRIHRWTRDELIQIRDHYRAKVRELRKERAWENQ